MSDLDTEVSTPKSPKVSQYLIGGGIIVGTIITCCLSVIINKMLFGGDIIKIDKVDRTSCLIVDDLEKIDYTKILLFNVAPVLINSLVWIGVIMFILRKSVNNTNTETDNINI